VNFQLGGPLVRENGNTPTLVGIFSYVQTTTCVNDIQGMTRVDKYLDWINSYTGMTIRA
jgi:secreted trypsin-like serine protease